MSISQNEEASITTSIPRRKRPKRRKIKFLIILTTAVLVGNSIVGERGLIVMLRANREVSALSEAISSLQVENTILRKEIRELQEEPWTIEELARQELGLIEPGEKLFIVRLKQADDVKASRASSDSGIAKID